MKRFKLQDHVTFKTAAAPYACWQCPERCAGSTEGFIVVDAD